jgi:hypothetical protein
MMNKTRQGLDAFDNQHDFERLAADLLNALGYSGVEPMSPKGGADGGCDIRFRDADASGIAFVTLDKRIREKFHRDLSKQHREEGLIALFCTVDVSPAMKLEFAKAAAELCYRVEVFDVERLRSLLDGRFKDIRRRYLHIDDEVAERVRSEISRLLRFPAAVGDDQENLGLLESLLRDQLPRRLFDVLMRYEEQDVLEVPQVGVGLHDHMLTYHRFRQDTTAAEFEIMEKLPGLWNPPLPGALHIHARYSILRFAKASAEEICAGVNFLNYGITWERAEIVFQELARDGALVARFDELLQRHERMSAAVVDLAAAVGPKRG